MRRESTSARGGTHHMLVAGIEECPIPGLLEAGRAAERGAEPPAFPHEEDEAIEEEEKWVVEIWCQD